MLVVISLGKVSGAQKENDKSESGESGKSFSKLHSGSRGSTYTMRDEQLRSNQELTRPETTGGNLVPVRARRSGAAQEDSYLLIRRYCECRSIVFRQTDFSHLKFFERLVAIVRAGDRGSLIVRQAHSNTLRRHRQTHARTLQQRFLDGPQPVETLQLLVFREVTQPLKFARRVVSPR